MNNPSNFQANLQLMKTRSNLSLTQFSEMAQVPRSTMQSVMKGGQTTLDTACRIANSLGMPLSILTGGILTVEQADMLHGALMLLDLYRELPEEKQAQLRLAVNILLEVFQK